MWLLDLQFENGYGNLKETASSFTNVQINQRPRRESVRSISTTLNYTKGTICDKDLRGAMPEGIGNSFSMTTGR